MCHAVASAVLDDDRVCVDRCTALLLNVVDIVGRARNVNGQELRA